MAVAVGLFQTVAEKLSLAMQSRDMSPADLAAELVEAHAPPTRIDSLKRLIHKWLSGTVKPGPRYAHRLAEIFSTDPDFFLDRESHSGATRAPAGSGSGDPVLKLVLDADAVRAAEQLAVDANTSSTWQDIPKEGFDKKFIAEQLCDRFPVEHLLVDRVDQWEELRFAQGTVRLDADTLGLGSWFDESPVMPGMVILECLSQIASVAMLTSPKFRQRIIQIAGYHTPPVFKKAVHAGSTLLLTASMHGDPHGRFAHYETVARIVGDDGEPGEIVAVAVPICVA